MRKPLHRGLPKRDIIYFKQLLLNQRAALLNKSNSFMCENQQEKELLPDEMDVATNELNLNLSIRLQERERVLIHKIDSALVKIANSTYGLCDECGETMSVKRLRARPVASLCIACKEDQEDRERIYA